MCTKESATLAEIQATGLGEMECAWLNLVRLHCTSYEQNRAEGWDAALGQAEAAYGADQGPAVAARIAVLVRTLRAERRGGFGYLSPHCPNCRLNITDDEWQLITLMQAGYRGDPHAIAEAAADLARRTEAPLLAAAAARFGTTLAAALGQPARVSPAGLVLH